MKRPLRPRPGIAPADADRPCHDCADLLICREPCEALELALGEVGTLHASHDDALDDQGIRRPRVLPESLAAILPGEEDLSVWTELLEAIDHDGMMAQLPVRQAQAVRTYMVVGSFSQLAAEMGASRQVVHRLVRKGIARLRGLVSTHTLSPAPTPGAHHASGEARTTGNRRAKVGDKSGAARDYMNAASAHVQPTTYKPHQVRVTSKGTRLALKLGAADRFWFETAPAEHAFLVHFDEGAAGVPVQCGATYRTDMAMCGGQVLRFSAAHEFDLVVIVKIPAVA